MFANHLQAVSMGPFALKNQKGGIKKGQVHSVFRRVINIAWPNHNLSSISRIDVCNGPANIVTNLPIDSDFGHFDIKPGASVWLDEDAQTLNISNISVTFTNAPLWESPLAHLKASLSLGQLKMNLEEVEEWINLTDTKSSGLALLFPHLEALQKGIYLPSGYSDPLTYLAGQAINVLLPSIHTADTVKIRNSASSLIGLGPGLTPSGDDYLAGLLLSLTAALTIRPKSFELAQNALRKTIIDFAPRLTNDISSQMLFFAAQGMGSQLMENMVVALFNDTQPGNCPSQAAKELTAVGASSGFDQLLGIISGARLFSSLCP